MTDVSYHHSGRVATITIDREDRRNALSPEVVRGIGDALRRAEDDRSVGCAVVTGTGERAFCAGADLDDLGSSRAAEGHLGRAEIGGLFARMRRSRLPIVARVNGVALAGGFGLMLACDHVVAADDAEMGTPEINVGLWPFMVSALIHRDLPRKVALDLMLSGRRVPASEGAHWGFVNRVVPRADLDRAVAEVTETFASKSPAIVELGKRSFYRAENMDFDAALEYLAGMLSVSLQTEDAAEGVSAFLQKRTPEWKGR
jgi:enoyl-CoA hydratase